MISLFYVIVHYSLHRFSPRFFALALKRFWLAAGLRKIKFGLKLNFVFLLPSVFSPFDIFYYYDENFLFFHLNLLTVTQRCTMDDFVCPSLNIFF